MNEKIKQILIGLLIISIFGFTYVKILKASMLSVIIILTVIFLYAVCMGVCEESMKQLKKYEIIQTHTDLTKNQRFLILFLSLTTLSPTYFCVLLVSVIPLFTYEVWFLTVFPCLIFISLPMISVLEEYHTLTKKKLPLIISFAVIIIFLTLVGVTSSHLILNSIQ